MHFACVLIMYVLGIWSFVNGLATKRPGFLWLLYCEGERESRMCMQYILINFLFIAKTGNMCTEYSVEVRIFHSFDGCSRNANDG